MKKRILSVVMIATMLCTLFVVPAMAKDFPDSTGHWAEPAIKVWSDRGVVNGDDAGNFRPGDPITRAETATIIYNILRFEKASNKVFSDVSSDAWYAEAINRLYAAEVMTGYEDGTIRPGNNISRQEAAVIIARAFALDTKKADQNLLSGFTDNDQIQDWARPTVAYMAGLAFVQGSDGMFRPGDPITRAEVVTILNNMVGIYADGSQSTYTGNYGDKIAIIKAPTTFNGVTLGGAVVCGSVKGKVNFNSGSKISGCLCNWAADAAVSTAGATVASTSNKNGGSISAGGNFNPAYGGGSAGGGSLSGGSAGGSAGGPSGGTSHSQFNVTFYANGGQWENGATQGTVTYALGNSYALRLPLNPARSGYTFDGWYTNQISANNLNTRDKMVPTEMVTSTSCKAFYAGWRKPSGLSGTVAVATGDNVAGRGKSASELMDHVVLVESTAIDTFTATGGLRYVTGDWSFPNLNAEGNFLALTYTLPASVTDPTAVILKSGFSDGTFETSCPGFTSGNRSYTRVFEISASDLTKDIVFTVDLDGTNTTLNTITVDLSELVRYEFLTVDTVEEFTAALTNPAAEKITVASSLTLPSGTYGPAEGRKAVILQQPLLIAEDADITLKNLDVVTDGTLAALVANATEIPTVEPVDETPGDETPTPVATRAAALNLENLSVTTGGLDYVLNEIHVAALTVKNTRFYHNTANPACAIVIGAPAAGDTVLLQDNVFDGYAVALEYKDIISLTTEGNSLKKNQFLNNTTDIKVGVEAAEPGAIPNVAYNYFDGEPVIAGNNGALEAILYPTYTAATMAEADLSENLHDAYIFVDGVYQGKFFALSTLELTFATEDTPCEIVIVPADLRDTVVTVGDAEETTVTLRKGDLPTNLVIQVGNGTAKTVAVSESAPLE